MSPRLQFETHRWENKCISFLEELKRVGPSRSLCFRPSHGEQVEGRCAGPLAAWAPAGVCPRAGHQKPGRIGTGPGCTDEADQSALAEVSVAKAALWAPRDRRLQLAAPQRLIRNGTQTASGGDSQGSRASVGPRGRRSGPARRRARGTQGSVRCAGRKGPGEPPAGAVPPRPHKGQVFACELPGLDQQVPVTKAMAIVTLHSS